MLALFAAALAGPLPEPLPPDTALVATEESAEFVRYKLHTDRDFFIEITPSRPGTAPVCAGGGFDLFVRLSLRPGESFEWEPLPPVVDATCARLAEHPPDLAAPPAPAPIRAPAGFRPLHLVIAPLVALLLPGLRGRRFFGVLGLALLARFALSPRTILLGGDAPYELLLLARGDWGPHPRYGDGWAALLGPIVSRLGTDAVHTANLVFSALGAAWLVHLGDRLRARPGEAALAGALLALAPLSLGLAGMETQVPLVTLLQIVAVEGALRADRAGPVQGALAAGLLAHLRPEQLAFAVLPLGILAFRRRALAAALLLALVGARAAALGAQLGQGVALVGPERALSVHFLLELLIPRPGAANLWLDPRITPFAAPILGAVGLLALYRERRFWLLGVPLLAVAFGVGPLITKTWPVTDAMRFQAPGLAALALFAAAGLFALPGVRLRAAGLAALALSAAFCRAPRYAWSAEYDFLRALPPQERVVYDAHWDENGHFGEWLRAEVGGDWRARQPGEGDLIYVGTADALSGRSYPCAMEPLAEARVRAASDGWVDFEAEWITVGLYRPLCQ